MSSCADGIVRGPSCPSLLNNGSLASRLLRQLREHGGKIAQIYPLLGKQYSFQEILARAITFKEDLRKRGIGKADVVVVFAPICPEFTPIFLGTVFSGAIIAPLSIELDKVDIKVICEILQPKLIIAERKIYNWFISDSKLRQEKADVLTLSMPECAEDEIVQEYQVKDNISLQDTVLILGTSGTSGKPKAVMHSNFSVMNLLVHLKTDQWFLEYSDDIVIQYSPYSWVSGAIIQIATLDLGALNILLPKFDEETFLTALHDYKVNVLFLSPNNAVALSKYPGLGTRRLRLRKLMVGGAAMDPQVHAMVEAALGVRIFQAYGMTEANAICVSRDALKPGSTGTPLTNVLLKVVDPATGHALGPNEQGEVCVQSPLVMAGYYNDPQATAQTIDKENWLHTGDLGYYDEEGHFYIVDRLKDVMKYRGHMFSPLEIESLLMAHEGVLEAAVVGTRHLLDQEHATAFVVRKPGASVTEDELLELVKEQLSWYKWLYGGVHFVEELPRTSTGKVLRRELRTAIESA